MKQTKVKYRFIVSMVFLGICSLSAQVEESIKLLADNMPIDPNHLSDSVTKEIFDEDKRLRAKVEYNLSNQKNGKAIWYYSNGQIHYVGIYKNGEKHGRFKSYYDDGILRSKEKYKQGKRNGKWIRYYQAGQDFTTSKYKNGNLVSAFKRFYPNGQLEFTYKVKNGIDGIRYIYDISRNPKNGIHEVKLTDGRIFMTHANDGVADGEFLTKTDGIITSKGN